jgi:hypothetical protein
VKSVHAQKHYFRIGTIHQRVQEHFYATCIVMSTIEQARQEEEEPFEVIISEKASRELPRNRHSVPLCRNSKQILAQNPKDPTTATLELTMRIRIFLTLVLEY